MAKDTEIGWAIVSEHGLYTGWQMTRADAIAGHVHALYGGARFARSGKLDDFQREKWAICKARGDRAVKVEIRILP